MDEALFAKVDGAGVLADSVDMTERMLALRRCKIGAETAILRTAAEALSEAEDALRQGWGDGLSDSACLASAQAAALRAGAQDVRVLFSADDGDRFEPYQGLDDDSSDHLVVYLALRRWGYWVDGFVTLAGVDLQPGPDASWAPQGASCGGKARCADRQPVARPRFAGASWWAGGRADPRDRHDVAGMA